MSAIPQLAWTGERMVPHASDIATELFHWQRYLYFRPWYQDANVIDAASGEGYGTNYASVFAQCASGVDISSEATEYAARRYPHAVFATGDVCEADYSAADLVISFETIEHLPDPSAFLAALAACDGRIVISTPNRNTHSPGNCLEDKPFNQFHTVEWTPSEFATLILKHFPNRQVRFLSQEGRWPGLIREGFDEDAMYCIAVIGDGELPSWPRLGISMPTCNNASQVNDAILTLTRVYPGEMQFAVVANGTDEPNLAALRKLQSDLPHVMHLIEETTNLGYGRGANRGLAWLKDQGFDYYGVINDDVLPATDCVNEMVAALQQLIAAGHNPGLIGPVSNNVNGQQQVDIGMFQDLAGMNYLAETWHRDHHSCATQAMQVRGLFFLMTPECLAAVGGFDPRFGLGNFEDDDLNLRIRLAGFSLWIADGAYLFHHGSTTFRTLEIDYEANIQRNSEIMAHKWGLETSDHWVALTEKPDGLDLLVPLDSTFKGEHSFRLGSEEIDLVHQAADIEFAVWVMNSMRSKPREARRALIDFIAAA